jgi:hypothetical protein
VRSRNIKPGFFRNELLAECDPFARLLFAGLWCISDRSGRLEDRPRRIKAEVLPFDSCNIDALLGQLEKHGFIRRYSVDGRQFIEIPKFMAHQNPHMREAPSSIPDNDSGKHSARTVLGTAKAMPSPADSLIPDSLIPDSKPFCPEPEKSPAHLSADEDLTYRRLIDLYYVSERSIPLDLEAVSRKIRMPVEPIRSVLSEFFRKDKDGWHNTRCDSELRKYAGFVEQGKLGAAKRWKNNDVDSLPIAPPIPTKNQEPRTSKPIPPISPQVAACDPKFITFWTAYPKKIGRGAAEKAWGKAHVNGELESVLAALAVQKCSAQWKKNGGEFIPNPSTWINQKRWLDEPDNAPGRTDSLFLGAI